MSHHSRERSLGAASPDFKEEPNMQSDFQPRAEVNPAQQKDLEEALVLQMEMQRKLHEQLEVGFVQAFNQMLSKSLTFPHAIVAPFGSYTWCDCASLVCRTVYRQA